MAGDDYYEILGVERTASNDEIKQAYFSLARQYHPDSNPSESAAEYFLVLQKAYETLRNPKKRKEHDLMLLQAEPEVEMINVSCQLSASEIPINPDSQLVYALMELESLVGNVKSRPTTIHLCFVIDCSTSMHDTRINMVKESIFKCLKNLSPNDLISIVAFNDFSEIVLAPTRITDIEKINNKIRDLRTGGGTEIFKGLKTGVDLLWEGNLSTNNRYLILLTDGHTYGDEKLCFDLAQKAAKQGVIIATAGIGSDWNDKFLDKLANLTGGTSVFIYQSEDLYNYVNHLTLSLKNLFAHNTTIEILCDKRVRLNYLFRIEPSVAELGIESPISIGDLHTDSITRLLFAFQVDNAVAPEETIRLATGLIKSTAITEKGRKIRKNYKISVKIKNTPSHSSPPIVILNAISRITMYQMQEKARNEVQEGSIDQAVRHLESMATRMLIQGNQPLANIIIREADHISKERAFSSDGEKRIKYGTRALLQLPSPMKREE